MERELDLPFSADNSAPDVNECCFRKETPPPGEVTATISGDLRPDSDSESGTLEKRNLNLWPG